ncbi:conserved exported hypothetical protein [Cupriavidus taiwanensis]|uniref:Bug family tripartite tricarboxylate transporter substrate binding protein n=1 Tax=Cupriavidus taiwanensis TaxID=164546 RepID=UPI000E1990E9|nr:tripartite tricarboxylate transporter substrate binding protein [Cupriavidus taiwanensis]SOZ99787.1 conserved exported hypothetical protein [Cupriavidus taiwanensis]
MAASRRITFIAGILSGALVLSAFLTARARAETPESYPSKPVRVIVPLPAGGATDSMARTLAERLSSATGQAFVVENRPGASGAIGADLVARAKPDGYTLMVSIGSVISLVPYTTKVSYKPDAFLPVSELARTPQVMYANPKISAKDLPSLVKWAKANPGKLSFASFSAGTQGHFAGVRLNQLAGIDMLHVAYKGSSPAMQDLLGGQVQVMFDAVLPAMNYVKSGRLLALATAGTERSPFAPDVPTFRELGYPEMEQFNGNFGLFAPAGLSPELSRRLETLARHAVSSPEYRSKVKEFGLTEPEAVQISTFSKKVREDQAKWSSFVNRIGYKPEM